MWDMGTTHWEELPGLLGCQGLPPSVSEQKCPVGMDKPPCPPCNPALRVGRVGLPDVAEDGSTIPTFTT